MPFMFLSFLLMPFVVNTDRVVVDTNTFDTDDAHAVGDVAYVSILVVDTICC